MPLRPQTLAASFGQTEIRLEVRSASPQFDGDFNAEKEWQKRTPTPWDVMQLSPVQALTICGIDPTYLASQILGHGNS